MKKTIWIVSILSILIFSFSIYYIYGNNDYLMEHSTNLQTGKGVESCRKVNAGFLVSTPTYVCDNGYYKVAYPTHQRIFHFSHSSNQISTVSVKIKFLDNVNINTFKVLSPIYGADIKNLYSWGERKEFQGMNYAKLEAINENQDYIKDDKYIYYLGFPADKKLSNARSKDYRFVKDNLRSNSDATLQPTQNILISNGNIYFRGEEILAALRKGKFIINPYLKDSVSNCIKIIDRYDSFECWLTENGEDASIKHDRDSLEVIAVSSYHELLFLKDKNHVYVIKNFSNELIVIDGIKPEDFPISYDELGEGFSDEGCNYSIPFYFNNKAFEESDISSYSEREEGVCKYSGYKK